MKAILIIIVLLIFLFRKNIEGQSFKKEEGFSFAEKILLLTIQRF